MIEETQDMQHDQTENQEIQEASQENSEQQSESSAKSERPTPQDSFRQLREQKERAERERDEMLQRLNQIEQRQKELAQASQKPQEFEYGDDDLVEGRHLKKEREAIRKELQEYRQRVEEMSTEARLKSTFPDFEAVVNDNAIKKLRQLYPSIAASISQNPNLYEKAEAAYAAIKQFGLYERNENTTEKSLAEQNSKKPQPLSTLNPQQGDTPLSRANAFANGLTPELERQLRKEVEDAIKRR